MSWVLWTGVFVQQRAIGGHDHFGRKSIDLVLIFELWIAHRVHFDRHIIAIDRLDHFGVLKRPFFELVTVDAVVIVEVQ